MSEQEITAGELEQMAGSPLTVIWREEYRRAARTIRRLEGEVARATRALEHAGFRDCGGAEWKPPLGQPFAASDRELGALVRRIREHPEGGKGHLTLTWKSAPWGYAVTPETLANVLDELDEIAHRRAAEEGERAPSGVWYTVREGRLSVRHTKGGDWHQVVLVPMDDLDVVERVRKGVPRGE